MYDFQTEHDNDPRYSGKDGWQRNKIKLKIGLTEIWWPTINAALKRIFASDGEGLTHAIPDLWVETRKRAFYTSGHVALILFPIKLAIFISWLVMLIE